MNLSIRKWRISDKSDLAENLSNPKVLNNLRDGLPYPYTEQDAEAYIKSMLSADKDSTYAFAITLDDKAIGSIGVFQQDNIHFRTAEMGYYIGEPYWGHGYMPEAVKEVMRYAFEELKVPVIYCGHAKANINSSRLQDKCGFKIIGELPNYRTWVDGSTTSLIERRMTSDEYFEMKKSFGGIKNGK